MEAAPILLIGGNGQVGYELQRALAPLGTLQVVGRRELDLSDTAAIRSAIRSVRPRLIVNAAAYTAVDRAEAEPTLAMLVNAAAPGAMAEEALALGAPLVHYSTDYVFDGTKSTPYVETDSPHPLSMYGETKLAGEQAICERGALGVILRTSWVFGETGQNFVRTVLRLAAERDALRVVDDQIGAPTPAALIADVTAHIIRALDAAGWRAAEVYHLAAAGHVTWHGFARRIVCAAAGAGIPLRLEADAIERIATHDYPTPARRPRNSRLDCTRLEERFALRLPAWAPYLERMLMRTARARP